MPARTSKAHELVHNTVCFNLHKKRLVNILSCAFTGSYMHAYLWQPVLYKEALGHFKVVCVATKLAFLASDQIFFVLEPNKTLIAALS